MDNPDVTLTPARDVAQWLLGKGHLLAAHELWFELEDVRDAADPTEPQARGTDAHSNFFWAKLLIATLVHRGRGEGTTRAAL